MWVRKRRCSRAERFTFSGRYNYRAFLKICDEVVDHNGRFHLPIQVPTTKLLRYAGKPESSRRWKEVREWFGRMTGTLVEGSVFQAKTKHYLLGFKGTVLSQVITSGDRMKNGQVAETNYVWPAPWFLSNYFYGCCDLPRQG